MKYIKIKLPKIIILLSIPFACLIVCLLVTLIQAILNKNITIRTANPYQAEVAELLENRRIFVTNLNVEAIHNLITNEDSLNVNYQSDLSYWDRATPKSLNNARDDLAAILCAKYQQFDKIYPEVWSASTDRGSMVGSTKYYYTCKAGAPIKKVSL